jgi:hypothetical protein
MRRLAMDGMAIEVPGLPSPELVPPVMARVLLGGKVEGYRGLGPGLFEEALVTLERQRPLYVLGGFGGASVLAKALLGEGPGRPMELTLDWHTARSPMLSRLEELTRRFAMPPGTRTGAQLLDDLFQRIEQARANLRATLNTGLDEVETRELLTTRDMGRAVQLVRKGLAVRLGLIELPE